MKYSTRTFLVIVFISFITDLVNTTTDVCSTEFDDLINSEVTFNDRTRWKNLAASSPSTAHLCFFSGNKTNKTYPNDTYNLCVELITLKKSFEIKTNLNQHIFELKETIRELTGYRCDQQRLHLFSQKTRKSKNKLKDGNKLGDYINVTNGTCDYTLKIDKRRSNKNIQFNSIPNVTHYEYVMMSSHVYQPDEPFLDGWNVTQYNLLNKNGLAFAIYVNPKRHQCVISIRGTDLSQSLFNNPITDLRLLFTNQTIDTLDSARLVLFHDELIHIPRQDSIPYVISFTGHSLGAALAESFACIYNAYAVTFDSPGTSDILNNDPSCRINIELGYNPKKQIHTYLGSYANLINVAHPQFGQVIYLKQFGDGGKYGDSEKYVYMFSSSAGVYLAACIFVNFVDKTIFKLGLWFTIGYFIKESSIVYSIINMFNLDMQMFMLFDWYIKQLPFLITVFLLCQLIGTLADMIEYWICKLFNPIIGYIHLKINFNNVLWRFALLSMYIALSCLISIGLPVLCYLWWLKSAHSVNKFVESFNPIDGNPYKGQSIESTLWPTLFDYLTKNSSYQFLLFLLIIQSMKLIAFHLIPSYIPRWLRLNSILILFAVYLNIDSVEHIAFICILFFIAAIQASQRDNQHFVRNIVCVTAGLLAIIQILNTRHAMNKFYCEIFGCPVIIAPFIRRFLDLF